MSAYADLSAYASAHRAFLEGVCRTGVLMHYGEPEPSYERLEKAYYKATDGRPFVAWLLNRPAVMRVVLWLL